MRKLALLLASLLIVANGCVISPRRSVGSTTGSGGSNSEFSVSANPTSQIITAGGSATYTISVSPLNGFTGTVSLNASSSSSTIVASFDTTTITGGSGSAVLTASTTSATPAGNATITVTARDSSNNNVSQNVAVTASVQSAASPASELISAEIAITPTGCVSTPAGSTAQRVSFPVSPAKGFTATFSVIPSSSAMDAALGFFAPSSSEPKLSSLINFSPAGVIQVRSGDSLISSAVPYAAGETLQFRLVENLPATTFSLFVTPPAAAEIPLATDLQVPSGQRGATTLGGWGQLVNAPVGATLAVCNFSLQ